MYDPQRLVELMVARRVNLKRMVALTGLSRRAITAARAGRRANVHTIELMAAALGLPGEAALFNETPAPLPEVAQ